MNFNYLLKRVVIAQRQNSQTSYYIKCAAENKSLKMVQEKTIESVLNPKTELLWICQGHERQQRAF